MAKNKYTDDYELVVTTDEKGREKTTAVYRGKYFNVKGDRLNYVQYKSRVSLWLVLILAMHIGSGFIGNRGTYQMFVGLPYALAFFALLFLAYGAIMLPKENQKLRRDQVGPSFERMQTAGNILFVLVAVGVVGEIAHLLFFLRETPSLSEYIYLGLQGLELMAIYALNQLQKRIRIDPMDS